MADEMKEIAAKALAVPQNGHAQDIVEDSCKEFAEHQVQRNMTAGQ